jgi:hypothetical protein
MHEECTTPTVTWQHCVSDAVCESTLAYTGKGNQPCVCQSRQWRSAHAAVTKANSEHDLILGLVVTDVCQTNKAPRQPLGSGCATLFQTQAYTEGCRMGLPIAQQSST